MNIAFDITALAEAKTGIGQYRYNLLKELSVLSSQFSALKITAYGFNLRSFKELKKSKELFHKSPPDKWDLGGLSFKLYRIPRKPLILSWIFLRKPSLDYFIKDADLFHVSDNVQSPTKKPTVATIHDLSAVLYPQFHSRRNSFVDKYRFEQMSKYASQIICVSENTKNDFLNKYKFDKDRVHVVYNGVDHEKFFKIKDFEKIRIFKEKYKLWSPYILYLGTIEPRKNVLRLVKAFYNLKEESKIIQKLVICGKKGWDFDEIFKFVKEKKLQNDVIFLGYIEESDKNTLINASDFVVYPSLFEGFGLPVAEAMACGKAVITSNNSSLPEVGEMAALYIDPLKEDDIADKILTLCKNHELKSELEKRAISQAEKFSWKRCAKETMDIYKKVLPK